MRVENTEIKKRWLIYPAMFFLGVFVGAVGTVGVRIVSELDPRLLLSIAANRVSSSWMVTDEWVDENRGLRVFLEERELVFKKDAVQERIRVEKNGLENGVIGLPLRSRTASTEVVSILDDGKALVKTAGFSGCGERGFVRLVVDGGFVDVTEIASGCIKPRTPRFGTFFEGKLILGRFEERAEQKDVTYMTGLFEMDVESGETKELVARGELPGKIVEMKSVEAGGDELVLVAESGADEFLLDWRTGKWSPL